MFSGAFFPDSFFLGVFFRCCIFLYTHLNETLPEEIIRKAKELGLVGLFIPEEYDGPGFGYLEQAMVLEEFWRVDPGVGQQLSANIVKAVALS